MDYQRLKALIPRLTQQWTIQDVSIWLKFISLQAYVEEFRRKSVDGSCLKFLDVTDLTQQIGIKSRIICKKLMNWLWFGLQQFDNYLRTNQQNIQIAQNQQSQSSSQFQLYIKTQVHSQKSQQITQLDIKKSVKKKQEWQVLYLKRVEGKQNIYYKFKQSDCRIGSDPNCEILVPGQNIDPFHAHISFRNRGYFLHNLSKSSEIFIKVNSRLQIQHGMEIEMGSNIFKFFIDTDRRIQIKIVQGKNEDTTYKFLNGQNKIMVGRKTTNDISLDQDNTLSNIHAKITYSDYNWYIQDLATTNGTWIQLRSQLKIYSGLVFKLDTSNHQFQCQLKIVKEGQGQQQNIKYTQILTQNCYICGVNPKNILFMPCSHCVVCQLCGQSVQKCIICSTKVQSYTKIYKS